ncbi:sulfurtransferase complex subunit TusD [Halopseudomonas phragmitis]|uniref:Sulfurtransferase TusD n=2 Tax=Pseudomonadaceae TaxID=135621 RepID=A0A1V0B715_9GAMM|nr:MULTISPECIES: sulfurtransferase complex subunit TusD [Pseudomonadaceae]AQZ95715.1 sulfurtransferase TusD [Halopseudomonas phragmitis]PAU87161.1 sulfurtransferase complex subunit TusD [Pseudomonas sp. WN033]RHW22674.1 sulfurtransferase complex subunit TusD [Pseudomonas jilinensis]
MNFAIALLAGPQDPAARSALNFARAVVDAGHEINRLFFYRDAVHIASNLGVQPQDENDITHEWRQFITEHKLDAVVCIAAALRRGVLNEEEAQRWDRHAANTGTPWDLSGLGQWVDALQSADRAVSFGS